MFRWFNRKPPPPEVRQISIGEVNCPSGVLLLADPLFYNSVRVSGVPPGRHAVMANVIQYPEGGVRVARVGMSFQPCERNENRTLGTIDVDSAKIILIDESIHQRYWQDAGSERIGMTTFPGEDRGVRQLLIDKFGLTWHQDKHGRSVFNEPISPELEDRIKNYLQTIPRFADYPFLYFVVKTGNSWERICEVMDEQDWGEVVLDEAADARILAVTSGFGDGSYEVTGWYTGNQLQVVEVEFIGPDQEHLLKAFPQLKY